jgi:hypothetical protein
MRLLAITILFLMSSAMHAQGDGTLTFKVRKVEYTYLTNDAAARDEKSERFLSVMDLVNSIPAQLETPYVPGRNSRIVSCRLVITSAKGEVTRLAMDTPPVLDLLIKLVVLEPGTQVEVDQLQVIDSYELYHWVPGLTFGAVDLRSLKRVEQKLKKITG